MGNDGGDIPRRKELVKEKQKVEIVNAESVARGRARFCNLTNEKLKAPLAICRLGHIYNYENIVSALAMKALPEKYSYIRKLSDIKKIQVEPANGETDNYFCCPISKLEYNGFNKFVALWKCGHVFSRKALKEVNHNEKQCLICLTPYKEKQVIDLNLGGEKLEALRMGMKEQANKPKAQNQEKDEGVPTKKIKTQIHINSLDRIGGEFRDVLRQRTRFKEIFQKEFVEDWKINTAKIEQLPEQ